MTGRFRIADRIEVLRRGPMRILFNPANVNPVFFPSGGDEVVDLLLGMKETGGFAPSTLPDGCTEDMFEFFLAHSLIVPDTPGPRQAGRQCCGCNPTSSRLSSSRSVYLLLTHSCNQACIYCLNGIETYRKQEQLAMSEDVAYRALQTAVDSITDDGRLEVVFFGGEPLLNWDLAKEIIRYCSEELLPRYPKVQVHYNLTTNLTVFPDDLIDVAQEHGMTFLVDVDGPEEIHDRTRPFIGGRGSFRTTAAHLERLAAAGIQASLRATVTSHNVSRMLEVAQTHKDLAGASCAFVPLNPVDSDIQLLDMSMCPSPKLLADGLQQVYRSGLWDVERLFPFNEYQGRLQPGYSNRWGCGAPFGNTPVITAHGKIYSCIYLVGNRRYEVGDLMLNDFPKKDVLADMLDAVDITKRDRCSGCSFRHLCGGGCPVGVFSIADNPNASPELQQYVRDISCAVSKTVLTELFWRMADTIELSS